MPSAVVRLHRIGANATTKILETPFLVSLRMSASVARNPGPVEVIKDMVGDPANVLPIQATIVS